MRETMIWRFTCATFLLLGISSVTAGVNDSNGETTGFSGDELFGVIVGGVLGLVLVSGLVYYLYTRDHSIYDCGSYAVFKRCCKNSKETSELTI
ncbi:hypothetical protein KP79_PYT13315 [Mizuhopecten yessoensis]|uniref:Transmembrane protein n=1 Tax=Mizuhopecten yessoensis TaxID=6573 RepID=A0A210PT64_MIZYE|nr:hypothetical protein KP79_PYT13315 [Mizuhopecten yessoensis]